MKRLEHQPNLYEYTIEGWTFPTLDQLIQLVPEGMDYSKVEVRFSVGADGSQWLELWEKEEHD